MNKKIKYSAVLLMFTFFTGAAVRAEFEFDVDASNARFSAEYEPYYPMITAVTRTAEEIYERVSPTTHELTPIQRNTRMAVIEMYRKAGFDISWGWEDGDFTSEGRYEADKPGSWSTDTPKPLSGRYEQPFSIDACWNNKIPLDFPKVELPREIFSFSGLLIGTVDSTKQPGGNGTGIPVIIGKSADKKLLFIDQEGEKKIRKMYEFRCPENIKDYINKNTASDQHAIFIDDESKLLIHSWRTNAANSWSPFDIKNGIIPGYDIRCQCASNVVRLDGIGSDGRAGVYAVQVPAYGFMIKPWEISEPDTEISHAISGAINPLMTGNIYPATRSDAGARDDFTGNVGAVIEGAIVRLDPEFDLERIYDSGKLSLPAYKILKAMQDYGLYNLDKGGNSANHGVLLYTSTCPGDWKNNEDSRYNVPYADGTQGVENITNELKAFFANDEFFELNEEPKLFVTIPNVKYAKLDVNGDGVIDRTDEALVKENVDKELTDLNKICDINQDGELTGRDAEIYYNYFNDQGQHTFNYYNVFYKGLDKEQGYIASSTDYITKYTGNTLQIKEGAEVSFGAVPLTNYEFVCWTGDFEGVTTPTLLLKMDKDYTFGARFKKKDTMHSFKINVDGPGRVEVSTPDDNGKFTDAAEQYGENTLLSIHAVKDDNAKFLGWEGDVSGFSDSISYVVKKDTEITAVFADSGYIEKYDTAEWKSINDSYNVTFSPNTINFGFNNFKESTSIYNVNSYIDDGYVYSVRVNCSTPLGDGNKAKIYFDYQDPKNYYFITMGNAGSISLGKMYRGISGTLRTYVRDRSSEGVSFTTWPIDIRITRTKDGHITVEGFKENVRLVYFDNIKDTTFKGGMIGVGSEFHGYLKFQNIVLHPIEENAEE